MRTFRWLPVIFLIGTFYFFISGKTKVEKSSLRHLAPENYHYKEAERCSNCKGEANQFMLRATGIRMVSGSPVLDDRGWLASTHARSQNHGNRINTACAWCHAPGARGATKDKKAAKPIPEGTWQGVSCGACHPGSLKRSLRKSLVTNYTPGTDPAKPENYIFRNRADGREMNAQCRFCHEESHDLLIKEKQEMMASGKLRCIDCHMAAYALTGKHVERFHNFKVARNIPHSCKGGIGRTITCHRDVSEDWLKKKLPVIKGPPKEWSSD